MLAPRTFLFYVVLLTSLPAPPSYNDYQAGVDAARRSEWPAVINAMTTAINQNPDEGTATMSDRIIKYHPYYYRGYANLKLGRCAEATADLRRATGAGEVFLGPLAELRQTACVEQAPPAPAPATTSGTWYDNYDRGIKAMRTKDWPVVVAAMSDAINKKPKEGNKERTYGAIFLNYHPYYYRGYANLKLKRYADAAADLELTSGPGEIDLGSIDDLGRAAKDRKQPPEVVIPQPAPPLPTHMPGTLPAPSPPERKSWLLPLCVVGGLIIILAAVRNRLA